MIRKFIYNGKEISEREYSDEFDKQNICFGTCVNRTSILDDGTFLVELIDYRKIWKQIGGPEPAAFASDSECKDGKKD